MSEKPKMYQNRINKEIHNNRVVYNSYDKDNKVNKDNNIYSEVVDTNEIRKKINSIINANNFIYSKMVHIVIGNETITRKIVGLYNNNLITIDNQYIPIDNIKDIYI